MKYKIHRCNCRKVWSVQNRKKKTIASSLLLIGQWKTELKPERKHNPKGFVTTHHIQELILNPPNELIQQYEMVEKLIYDKKYVVFNVSHGEYLYFTEEGICYILKKTE